MPLTSRQLQPIFDLIDEYGSIESFMHEVLGLEAIDIETIRNDLLE
jgi:hypothetical protein